MNPAVAQDIQKTKRVFEQVAENGEWKWHVDIVEPGELAPRAAH